MQRSVVVMLTVLWSSPSFAQYFIPHATPRINAWVAPDREFAISIPGGWNIYPDQKDPATFHFKPANNPGDAILTVHRFRVPKGASVRQLRLVALEQRLRKMPNFRETGRADAKIDGKPAASITGVYFYQGNAQFPRLVEEVFVVKDEEGFLLHFECFEPMGKSFARTLDRLYKSFVPRPSPGYGSEAPPAPNFATDPLIDPDNVPF